ncbi:efflux RND transporter periplasmic adaptor subunit [Niabella hibiscisoli]|uniref:efflux RND transporter periplasmic adaptor subunit n=1 Tax=Niabella hibiscisoli TaxID=1825928 RepID=UPI001F10BCE9|nr:efflux RND transporter periplasmic adaptor subunit [Niabella hibiscisoli]MCH5721322.1 efflux RND transporter periplasmic adaptor subunit [Niabella hibiscisoli]
MGILALIAYVLTNNKKKNEAKTAVVAETNSAIAVKIDTAKTTDLNIDFAANGVFAAGQEINFSAETAGRVVSVLVDEGSYVRKGQTLAIIKTDNLNVDVQNANETYQNAVKDRQRYESALRTGGVTQQQVDQAELAVKNAAARVQQARIKVTDANIRASINGIVNKRMIEPGSVLAAGTQLFEIVDVSKLTLDIAVAEQQVANLNVGDAVDITASVFPDKKFTGKIEFIAPKADANLNFPVKIAVANNAGKSLKAGMYGSAHFVFAQQAPAILISRAAFVGGVSSNEIFLVNAGKAELRKVVAGRILGDKVEVLQGLTVGDQVIVTGQINLMNGSAVAIIK